MTLHDLMAAIPLWGFIVAFWTIGTGIVVPLTWKTFQAVGALNRIDEKMSNYNLALTEVKSDLKHLNRKFDDHIGGAKSEAA